MANPYFKFRQFTIHHDRCAMKVTTDSCLFGAWAAGEIQRSKIQNALDIGTGTGLLALMIAQKKEIEIEAVEIDPETAKQANENIASSPWSNRVRVFNENILSFRSGKKYDCIISNPPFYENELASSVEKKNIAHHSEELTISQVLQFIKNHLREKGLFFLIYPFKRRIEIEALFEQNGLCPTDVLILSQSPKHAPFRMIIKGSDQKIRTVNTRSLTIWNDHQQYTQEFIELLRDYYLYLQE